MEDPKMTTHMRAFTIETDDPKVEAIMANMSRICAVSAAFDIRKHITDLINNKQALLSGAMGFSVTPEIFEHMKDSVVGWAMCVQEELQNRGLVDEEGKPILVMEEHLTVKDFPSGQEEQVLEEPQESQDDPAKTH